MRDSKTLNTDDLENICFSSLYFSKISLPASVLLRIPPRAPPSRLRIVLLLVISQRRDAVAVKSAIQAWKDA